MLKECFEDSLVTTRSDHELARWPSQWRVEGDRGAAIEEATSRMPALCELSA